MRARPTERGVPNTVTLHRHDVVVTRDRPELLNRIPVHGRLFSKPAVGRPRIDVELRIEHVDARHRRGLGCHRYDTARSDSAVSPYSGHSPPMMLSMIP